MLKYRAVALVYKEKDKTSIFENYVLHKNKTPLLVLNSKRTVFILHLADNTRQTYFRL